MALVCAWPDLVFSIAYDKRISSLRDIAKIKVQFEMNGP